MAVSMQYHTDSPGNEEMGRKEVVFWRDMPQPPQDIVFLRHEASWCQEIVQYG